MCPHEVEPLPLALLPTPLVDASNLSAALGGSRILVKRDDLAGRALGGNKVRKLQYLLADAQQNGATVVVTGGGRQSNHACQAAVCARLSGLRAVLVLGPGNPELCGNLLLERLLGVETVFSAHDHPDALEAEMRAVCRRLQDAGERPYYVPLGGSTPLGALGYRDCFRELEQQCRTLERMPAAVCTAVGTGGTLAGLIAGRAGSGWRPRLVGYDVGAIPEPGPAERIRALLDSLPGAAEQSGWELDRAQIGSGYARPSPGGVAAMRLFWRTEGILLDPVYTGKAAAGLVEGVRAGRFEPGETVVFLHTGGTAGFFTPEVSHLLESSPLEEA